MTVYVGTSGWQYRHWEGRFYPPFLPPTAELAFYADHFATVEVNATFYGLPAAPVFEHWAARTPGDFVFALKASRFLTHVKRLREPEEPAHLFVERARRLGPKLGPVLLQLPPTIECDVPLLERALDAFGPGVRIACEFREPSWFIDPVREALERHGAALCLADRRAELVTPPWVTSDWGYLRFHEGVGGAGPCYDLATLEARAGLLTGLWPAHSDVFAYFNDDWLGCAIRDAATFAGLLRDAGRKTSRTPGPEVVTVAS